MITDWEPPAGHARAAGGLLATVAGEAWRGDPPTGGFGPRGPVATALMDLAQSYVSLDGDGAPLEVAGRQDGIPAPAWLLPVAIVRPYSATLAADALHLARASGVPGHALSPCVGYVELAAELFAGRTAPAAIESVTGEPAPRRASAPALCGDPHLDALSTGIWALTQPAGVAELVPALAPIAPPEVLAAAAGLVGLRDGSNSIPAPWHHDVPDAATCLSLAADLVRMRHDAYLHPSSPRPITGDHAVVTPEPAASAGADPARASLWSWSLRR